jgi:hypothetical protein
MLFNTEIGAIREQGNVHRDFLVKCLGKQPLGVLSIQSKRAE